MILATWLSEAANEEQTSVLLVVLKAYNYFAILIHCILFLLNIALDFDGSLVSCRFFVTYHYIKLCQYICQPYYIVLIDFVFTACQVCFC